MLLSNGNGYSCSRGLSRSRVEKILYIAGEDAVSKYVHVKRAAKQLAFVTLLQAPKIASLCYNDELSQGLMPGRTGGLPPCADLSLYGINREKYIQVFNDLIALAQEYKNMSDERRENTKIFISSKILAETQREQPSYPI